MTRNAGFKVVARDYRVLHSLEWSPPPGVNLLTGPNGSGKSTTLSALKFLRGLFTFGHERGLSFISGVHLRRHGARAEDPVHFEFHVDDIHWLLDLPVDARGLISNYGETLLRGDEVVLRASMFQQQWYYRGQPRTFDDTRCCARFVWDHEEPEWMRPLVELLKRVRIYDEYRIDLLRQPSREDERRSYLAPNGSNLWTVLNTWKSAPRRHGDQFAWIMEHWRRAFPDVVGDLEFEGVTPHGLIFPPKAKSPDDGIPALLEADGVLTGLLHLTAVAGAPAGSILAIDEMENQLHPFAIRSLLVSMQEMADRRDLTILLTTHSPVLMNAFEDNEERLYVLEPDQPTQPVALSALHDPAWFTSFSLGRRYERGDFGAPSRANTE